MVIDTHLRRFKMNELDEVKHELKKQIQFNTAMKREFKRKMRQKDIEIRILAKQLTLTEKELQGKNYLLEKLKEEVKQ